MRSIRMQSLEPRLPLAGSAGGVEFGDWHNQSNAYDVNGDGYVHPIDVLQLINLIGDYELSAIETMQSAWSEDDPAAMEPYAGFHPDVSGDGVVGLVDILQVINRLAIDQAANPTNGQVAVLPDGQGEPTSVVFTSADGRSKSVDVVDPGVTVIWDQGNVYLRNRDGLPLIIAKPASGLLSAEYLEGDGTATVTRFGSDGSETTEQYVCIPGWTVDAPDVIASPVDPLTWPLRLFDPDDVRRPIEGFEETLGAIVSRHTQYADGSSIEFQYEEASAENLISFTASLATGESLTVNMDGATVPTDLTQRVWMVLRSDNPPASPISLTELLVSSL
ncbi:dockerin type I domain-containing protein [Stieleria sp. ICT_E10.1]|uniref:dockerin type I domain-containing protein n=1 Tax=Stieleria sedimenti TaxID=2976331 RepID=UPI002180875C|nr:dockerin type I domain-containing protein [Stieleria sedimenti]MCS7471118.1 dockerin type I domain-containing protein [Stieleria sedimenti]